MKYTNQTPSISISEEDRHIRFKHVQLWLIPGVFLLFIYSSKHLIRFFFPEENERGGNRWSKGSLRCLAGLWLSHPALKLNRLVWQQPAPSSSHGYGKRKEFCLESDWVTRGQRDFTLTVSWKIFGGLQANWLARVKSEWVGTLCPDLRFWKPRLSPT